MRRVTPSIQPTQSASSTASLHVIEGFPDPTFQKPMTSSRDVAAWRSSQARNAAAVAKNVGADEGTVSGRAAVPW